MKKIKHILIASGLFISCTQPAPVAKPSMFDSTANEYIKAVDSFGVYKNDAHFLAFKALVQKDTAYFMKMNRDLAFARNNMLPGPFDKCPALPSLAQLNYAEAYRLRILPSFYHNEIIIIAYKKDNSYFIELTEKGFTTIDESKRVITNHDTCKLFKKETKEIESSKWDTLQSKIQYADYWGMNPAAPHNAGLDGSDWTLEAISQNPNSSPDEHYVGRWSPGDTAFGEIGWYMISLLGKDHLKFYKRII